MIIWVSTFEMNNTHKNENWTQHVTQVNAWLFLLLRMKWNIITLLLLLMPAISYQLSDFAHYCYCYLMMSFDTYDMLWWIVYTILYTNSMITIMGLSHEIKFVAIIWNYQMLVPLLLISCIEMTWFVMHMK